MVKIICSGLPKTGTKSLAKALRILGYNVFDYPEAILYAFDDWDKIFTGKSPDMDEILEKIYSKDVEAVVDVPHSFFFEYFHRKWPDAKVILTIRDEDDWFTSYKNMITQAKSSHPILTFIANTSYSARRFLGWHDRFNTTAWGSAIPNKMIWTSAYRRHNCYVKSVIPKEKLLICSITEGWEPICKFLDKDLPKQDFPFENKAGTENVISEKIIKLTNLDVKIQREVFLLFLLLSLFFGLLFYAFLL